MIKSILELFKSPISWLMLIILVLIGYIGYIEFKNVKLENNIIKLDAIIADKDNTIGVLRQSNSEFSSAIQQYKYDFDEQIAIQTRLQQQNTALNRELRNKVAELERTKGRQEIVWQRPTLVERMLRRSWREFSDSISCESGEVSKCKD